MISGKTVKKGQGIIAATQSGNRDEDVFPNPDAFDMRRVRGKEEALGYGWGEHRCVAEWLARAELEIVFGESLMKSLSKSMLMLTLVATLWQKLPNLRLAILFEEVNYSPPTKDVGILDLPVVF